MRPPLGAVSLSGRLWPEQHTAAVRQLTRRRRAKWPQRPINQYIIVLALRRVDTKSCCVCVLNFPESDSRWLLACTTGNFRRNNFKWRYMWLSGFSSAQLGPAQLNYSGDSSARHDIIRCPRRWPASRRLVVASARLNNGERIFSTHRNDDQLSRREPLAP